MLEGIYWARHKQNVGPDWEVASLSIGAYLDLWFFGEEYSTAPDLYDLIPIQLTNPDGRTYPYKETST